MGAALSLATHSSVFQLVKPHRVLDHKITPYLGTQLGGHTARDNGPGQDLADLSMVGSSRGWWLVRPELPRPPQIRIGTDEGHGKGESCASKQ